MNDIMVINDNIGMMKMMIDVWSEGYAVSGNSHAATFHAKVESKSFRDACILYFGNDSNFNFDNMTYWGCQLYDNEQDARRNFR